MPSNIDYETLIVIWFLGCLCGFAWFWLTSSIADKEFGDKSDDHPKNPPG